MPEPSYVDLRLYPEHVQAVRAALYATNGPRSVIQIFEDAARWLADDEQMRVRLRVSGMYDDDENDARVAQRERELDESEYVTPEGHDSRTEYLT